MGLDLQTLRFVLECWHDGADFGEAATLGRQHLNVDRAEFAKEAARYGLAADREAVMRAYADHPYADGLLHLLGAGEPASIDAASFEGASHIADMNRPVPGELRGRFSLLIDGGTIEHIFDFRQAAINVGAMLKVGGTFISINGANNFMGHGFYQFSPELLYRVFAPENGFAVETMVLTEANADARWFDVADPATIGGRVELVNNARTYLMMRARKIAEVEMFTAMPQQSDYAQTAWDSTEASDLSFLRKPRWQQLVEDHAPRPARQLLRRLSQAARPHYRASGLTPRPRFD